MIKTRLIRGGVIVVGLAAWFWTQSLIGHRPPVTGTFRDGIHELTAPVNQWLRENPPAANTLLIVSSAVIDALTIFLLATTIFGQSVRPFLGLLILFAMRQVCQALCSLPPPDGMIWRNPGFPSLLVTYGVCNDLFFSGHTALAVYGTIELSQAGKTLPKVLAVMLALFEVTTVLVLRAHYTMDVVAGALAAFVAAGLARRFAPHCDAALARIT